MKNPKTGKDSSAASALKNKDNPNHKKAKGIFAKLKDRFSKKKDDKKAAPKKQSKSDADFYKRQYESVNEAGTKSIDGEELLNFLMKRFKMSRKQAIASMKKHNMDTSFLKKESDLGFTYKKGKTVKVTHKTSGKSLIIIDKPNVRKEYEKLGFYAEGKVDEAKSKTIKAIGSIIGKKQAKKIGGVLVDMQTANVIMKVWNALNKTNRKKFEKLSITKMANVAWKLMK